MTRLLAIRVFLSAVIFEAAALPYFLLYEKPREWRRAVAPFKRPGCQSSRDRGGTRAFSLARTEWLASSLNRTSETMSSQPSRNTWKGFRTSTQWSSGVRKSRTPDLSILELVLCKLTTDPVKIGKTE